MKYRHIEWVDLYGNGVLKEVAVMQRTGNGDLYYIAIEALDQIDRNRLGRIVSRRDAANYPLWDLMSQVTLANGMNALDFFQQLVKCKTYSGQHITPGKGFGVGPTQTSLTARPSEAQQAAAAQHVAASQAAQPEGAVRKGPGRPPKSSA